MECYNKNLVHNLVEYLNQERKLLRNGSRSSLEIQDFARKLAIHLGLNKEPSDGEIRGYLNEFYYFVWLKFDKPMHPNFGEEFFIGLSPEIQMNLVCAYIAELIRYNYKMLYYQILLQIPQETQIILTLEKFIEKHVYRNQGKSNDENCSDDELYDFLSETVEIQPPELATLGLIIQCYGSNMASSGDVGVAKLNPFIQDYIFERVWTLKNRPQNVHNDFGQVSFYGDKELELQYHCSVGDKMRILFDLYNNFEQI